MRFSVFITACVACLASEAALRFSQPAWKPDLGLSLPCLEGAVGEPLDMPRASAFLVTKNGEMSLEDRFDSFDLWTMKTMRGRWRDVSGNRLFVARLDTIPLDTVLGTKRTRRSFHAVLNGLALNPKNAVQRDEAAAAVSPVELGSVVRPRRPQRRNLKELVAYTTSDEHAIVCAFRPVDASRRGPSPWFLAALVASRDENMAEVRARFDEEFLDQISVPAALARRTRAGVAAELDESATEEELLRAAVRAQVVNYDEWTSTDSADVTVLDNLTPDIRRPFVTALTNNLPRLRRAYAACVPSPLVGTNALAVVRVFRSREEYLGYVGIEQKWTAAIWSPERRELVLYHTGESAEKLLTTVWHEAFHQYIAYAGSMIESSPWFNEGHAQLFEHSHFDRRGEIVFDGNERAFDYIRRNAVELAEILPSVMLMDYREFYSGDQDTIVAKYHLAWSITYFLEVGAPELRFRPYDSLRADYMKALIETKSMHAATRKILGDEKSRDAFVAAWRAFWREQ